jgi:hypothetical protein
MSLHLDLVNGFVFRREKLLAGLPGDGRPRQQAPHGGGDQSIPECDGSGIHDGHKTRQEGNPPCTCENSTTSSRAKRHSVNEQNPGLVIVQDLFLNETAREFGHVFFPAASSYGKDGTFMNSERHVQRIRQAIPPVGDSKPDWKIICELAGLFAFS